MPGSDPLILVINCGSSSVKYKLIAHPSGAVRASGAVERIGEDEPTAAQETEAGSLNRTVAAADHRAALGIVAALLTDPEAGALDDFSSVAAIGHRVVHGGERYTGSVRIDATVLEGIRACSPLAPLHNPANLAGIEAARHLAPGKPQVAVFDTAFHQTIPPAAYRYAVPEKLYREAGIRRYGFHGTSHQYVARRAAALTGRPAGTGAWITCHLGNGCSMAAVRDGRCLDTSMGMTPLEGLVMGTRCGDLDPAVLLRLGNEGWTFAELDRLLNRESGLLGLSGSSNDMRELREREEDGDERAALAIDVFCHRIRRYLGAFLAVLGGCDGVVFTGGIGAHGSAVRARILAGLAPLGMRLDPDRNASLRGGEGSIAADGSPVDLLVIPTDEEGEIARETARVIGA